MCLALVKAPDRQLYVNSQCFCSFTWRGMLNKQTSKKNSSSMCFVEIYSMIQGTRLLLSIGLMLEGFLEEVRS